MPGTRIGPRTGLQATALGGANMLTEEVYTVLERIDSLANDVFYRTCQLRDLGELVIVVIVANTSIDASMRRRWVATSMITAFHPSQTSFLCKSLLIPSSLL
jgi:hypothetical protein